jgi:hypothetical protein
MFIHSVYFWLKPGITAAEEQRFSSALISLTKIQSVRHGWCGEPAATDRPVIDRSYTYGLVVAFDDAAGHDAYQVDPVHEAFRKLHDLWTQVRIYDFTS